MNSIKTKIILGLLTVITTKIYSQQDKISLLFSIGNRSSYSTCGIFVLGYNLNDKMKVEIGPSIHFNYGGQGIASGLKWKFFQKSFFSTSLNADYRFLFPAKISIGYDNDTRSVSFKNPSTNTFFVGTSFNFILNEKKIEKRKNVVSLNTYYGFPFENYKTSYRDGDYSSNIENTINYQMAAGIGFSVSLTVFFY